MHFGSGIEHISRGACATSKLRAEVDEFQESFRSLLNKRKCEFQNLNTAHCKTHTYNYEHVKFSTLISSMIRTSFVFLKRQKIFCKT